MARFRAGTGLHELGFENGRPAHSSDTVQFDRRPEEVGARLAHKDVGHRQKDHVDRGDTSRVLRLVGTPELTIREHDLLPHLAGMLTSRPLCVLHRRLVRDPSVLGILRCLRQDTRAVRREVDGRHANANAEALDLLHVDGEIIACAAGALSVGSASVAVAHVHAQDGTTAGCA
eukprot:3364222-Prymnesium_polylepis.2